MDHLHTILIVDDQPLNRTLLSGLISGLGYHSVTAGSGAEALGRLDGTIDLIVLDALMPDMDGFELARRVRGDSSTAYLPLLMVTSLGSSDDRLRAVECGVSDFLCKPVDRTELQIRIAALLNLRDAERERRRLTAIVATSGDAILASDCGGIVRTWNPGAERLFGYTAAEIIGKSFLTLVPPEHRDETLKRKARILSGERIGSFDTVRVCGDGTVIDVSVTVSLIDDPSGAITGVSAIYRDITARKQQERQLAEYRRQLEEQTRELCRANRLLRIANDRLAEMATTDSLTGLLNRRAFQERLNQEMERVSRHGSPLSVLLLDIDRFKAFNDAFGHPAGDEALRTIGNLLRRAARAGDTVARFGGEEFVILMPDTDAAGACRLGERFRKKIMAYPWPRRPLTASFGAATAGPAATRETLIADADRALYLAKSAGRNIVTHIDDVAGAALAIPAG